MGSTLRLRLSTATGHELRASPSFALRVTATLSVKNTPAFVQLSVTEGDGSSTQAREYLRAASLRVITLFRHRK